MDDDLTDPSSVVRDATVTSAGHEHEAAAAAAAAALEHEHQQEQQQQQSPLTADPLPPHPSSSLPDFNTSASAQSPLSAIPISLSHYHTPLLKRGKFESTWKSVSSQPPLLLQATTSTNNPNCALLLQNHHHHSHHHQTGPAANLGCTSSTHNNNNNNNHNQNNPTSSSPTTTTAQQSSSVSPSPSGSSRSQPSQDEEHKQAPDLCNFQVQQQQQQQKQERRSSNNNADSVCATTTTRKGKYVSPVWKPHEMLWLARAWRIHYQGDPSRQQQHQQEDYCVEQGFAGEIQTITTNASAAAVKHTKSRADKDREVAEFLNKHGVNRDAKTAGTKWDNMLGEFRKVYEWEKGPEREQVGKSYFRLSPYERKLHRLPASFDEEVYEELAQFMGPRQRAIHSKNNPQQQQQQTPKSARTAAALLETTKDAHTPYHNSSSTNHMQMVATNSCGKKIQNNDVAAAGSGMPLKRIGKVKMLWEETAHVWAEEGEQHTGFIRLENLGFFNANELAYLDELCSCTTLEAFESGSLKGFSTDRFSCGQQLKIFGRHKPALDFGHDPGLSGHLQEIKSSSRHCGLSDRSYEFVAALKVPSSGLPALSELHSYLREPPQKDLRFPVRQDVYEDLPSGKEAFFCPSSDTDCRIIFYETMAPLLLRPASHAATESFTRLWDDCINNPIAKFCAADIVFYRKAPPPLHYNYPDYSQEEWPNLCGFVNNFCLWRAEETDKTRKEYDPSLKLFDKILWSYGDVPYVLAYYAEREIVTFCALSNSHDDRTTIRIDLLSLDLSDPSQRIKALVPCWRIAGILSLLADHCCSRQKSRNSNSLVFSDYQRLVSQNGRVTEIMPGSVRKIFPNRRRWGSVKEIYEFFDKKIPHSEILHRCSEQELALVFKPRGVPARPTSVEQLLEALKCVTKALVALHGHSFMHRDIRWETVMKKMDSDVEWFLTDFDEAVQAPHPYPHNQTQNHNHNHHNHAPEMATGIHGVQVDIWGVGCLIKTCGLKPVDLLRKLQHRCLDQDPEQRPSAAECYHHLVQLQSSLLTYREC